MKEIIYVAVVKNKEGYPEFLIDETDMDKHPIWFSDKEDLEKFLLKKKLSATILPWEW
jgi:hypothetical protein